MTVLAATTATTMLMLNDDAYLVHNDDAGDNHSGAAFVLCSTKRYTKSPNTNNTKRHVTD